MLLVAMRRKSRHSDWRIMLGVAGTGLTFVALLHDALDVGDVDQILLPRHRADDHLLVHSAGLQHALTITPESGKEENFRSSFP